MPRDQRYSFSLPRLGGAAMWILAINIVAFFIFVSLPHFSQTAAKLTVFLVLVPDFFIHGFIWQMVTYGFVDLSPWSILFSSLMMFSFGSMFEQLLGTRRFLQVYFISMILGGAAAAAFSYTKILGISPQEPLFGAWAGILGLVGAYGFYYANQESMMFPLFVPIKAKYMTLIFIGMDLAFLLVYGQLIYVASIFGAGFGYLYAKAVPRRGFGYVASESYFGARNRLRNAYYRWKRRRATRKFEVYMRKHDRTVYFDQYGNYIHPEDQGGKGKDEPGPGGWVN